MGKLLDQFAMIRKRHGMYIGDDSVVLLKSYLDGYVDGLRNQGCDDSELAADFELFDQFRMWLAIRLENKQAISWGELAEVKIGDSRNKVSDFYLIFDTFQNEVHVSEYSSLRAEYEIFLSS